MFEFSRSLVPSATFALAVAAVATVPAFGADTSAPSTSPAPALNRATPAFEAFRKTWDGVSNYAETIVAHETTNDGKDVQDRTYAYVYVKPDHALIAITAGPGRGGAVAWNGGPTVRGHKGGILAGIKLTLDKHDARVVSLRGDAVDDASFGHEIERYLTIAGTLSDGKAQDGSTTITFAPKATEASGVTREMLTFASNGLPSKREQFVGERSVKVETFSNVRINDPKITTADTSM